MIIRATAYPRAGLQDRVAQVYGGLVHMDFNRDLMQKRGYGEYRPIGPLQRVEVHEHHISAAEADGHVSVRDGRTRANVRNSHRRRAFLQTR